MALFLKSSSSKTSVLSVPLEVSFGGSISSSRGFLPDAVDLLLPLSVGISGGGIAFLLKSRPPKPTAPLASELLPELTGVVEFENHFLLSTSEG